MITNSSDDDWWQAKRLRFDGIEEPAPPGIIPSRKRYKLAHEQSDILAAEVQYCILIAQID